MQTARKLSWNEYFGHLDKYDKIHNGTALFDNGSLNNYYVFICFFEECKETGAIYIERTNTVYALIEDTVFYNCCTTSTYGGGSVMYFCREDGQFVQHRTCYYKSIAHENMAFVQGVKSSPSNKNYAFDVSVFKCGANERDIIDCIFVIAFGDIHFENNNITNNYCITCSSHFDRLEGGSGTFNFSTFRENNQTNRMSLYFCSYNSSFTHTISYCNVIGNICETDIYDVLFSCGLTTYVDHCIIKNNIAKHIFEVDGTLTISESYVDSNSTSGDGSIIFNNLTINYNFNTFHHLFNENCSINSGKIITLNFSFLSTFAKTASAGLVPSKK